MDGRDRRILWTMAEGQVVFKGKWTLASLSGFSRNVARCNLKRGFLIAVIDDVFPYLCNCQRFTATPYPRIRRFNWLVGWIGLEISGDIRDSSLGIYRRYVNPCKWSRPRGIYRNGRDGNFYANRTFAGTHSNEWREFWKWRNSDPGKFLKFLK